MTFPRILFAMAVLSCSACNVLWAQGSHRDGGWHQSVTVTSPSYMPPHRLTIYPYVVDGRNLKIIGNGAGSLYIDESGNGQLHLNKPFATLNKDTVKTLLGDGQGPQGEDDDSAYFWSFDVLMPQTGTQNIYHIDVQFADANRKWKKYRVRGYQITNPQWQEVQ